MDDHRPGTGYLLGAALPGPRVVDVDPRDRRTALEVADVGEAEVSSPAATRFPFASPARSLKNG